ncbi:hypothetical protein BASA61_006119 [Batrachochytrium salamandrivorans]|nr:hypothetical protein BASA61_006119 [Batrachochytrium salamandrivorans]
MGSESPADDSCGSRNEPLTSNLDTEHGSSSAINSMSDPGEGDSLPDHPLQDGGAAIAATAAPTPKKPNTRSLAASGHRPRFGYLPNSPSTHDHSHPQHHHKGIPNETPKTSETQGIFKIPEFFNFFKPSEAPKTYKTYKVFETGKTPGAFEDSEDYEADDAFEDPDTFEDIGIESDNFVDKFRSQITKAHADADQLKKSGLSLENLAAALRLLQDKLDKDMAKYQNAQNDRFLSLKAEYDKIKKPKKQESVNGETTVEQASQDSSEMQSSSAPSHPVTDPEI